MGLIKTILKLGLLERRDYLRLGKAILQRKYIRRKVGL